jgi:hypothetical protein
MKKIIIGFAPKTIKISEKITVLLRNRCFETFQIYRRNRRHKRD